MPMLTVDEAGKIILDTLQPLPAEMIPFAETLGRVLADDLVADAPVPPFAQSAMDGFALRSTDTLAGQARPPHCICTSWGHWERGIRHPGRSHLEQPYVS